MTLYKLFVWFIIYSFMGWIYESTFCSIKSRQWENRGFFHGPILPIYGVGAVSASIVFGLLPMNRLQHATWWMIFLICYLGSIILEYSTSWILEKLFHAYWWDYSKQPLNINGRVCFGASVGFGFAGILVVKVIYPFVSNMTGGIPDIIMQLLALIFMLLFGIDLGVTVYALNDYARNFARIEKEINDQISAAYNKLDAGVSGALGTVMEKKEQLQEGVAERKEQLAGGALATKELASEKLTSLREQITKERIESLFATSSLSQKHTLRNIRGFRNKDHKENPLGQRLVNVAKEHRFRK